VDVVKLYWIAMEEGTDNFYENQGDLEHSKILLDLKMVPKRGIEPRTY
jgi:hypothetical protein